MKTFSFLLCILTLCFQLSGCKSAGTDYMWKIRTAPATFPKDDHVYAPRIKEISLFNVMEFRLTLTGPFTTANRDVTPADAYNKISILNDSARQMDLKNYWFALDIKNFRGVGNWAMLVSNPKVREEVFIKRLKDSIFTKVQGMPEHTPYVSQPVATRYLLHLGFDHFTLLLKVSSTEPTFLKEVEAYAVDQSGKYQVTSDKKFGIAIGILSLLTIIFFYFFVVSRDFTYLAFILYAFLETLQYLMSLQSGYLSSLAFYDIMVSTNILTFLLLYLAPVDKTNRKFNLVFFSLLVLYLLSTLGNSYLGISFGDYWQIIVRGGLHAFLAFTFWAALKNNRGKKWPLLIALIASLLPLFYTTVSLIIFLPDLLLDNRDIINPLSRSAQYLTYIVIITLLIVKFNRFKKNQAEQNISRALKHEKEISDKVIAAQEEERERISKDLHDEIGGSLALVKIKLHNLDIKNASLDEIAADMNKVSAATKAIAYQLMPPYFVQTDFKMLLFSHFNQLNEKGGMKFNFDYEGQLDMPKEKELMLYRIILEMVQNCIKHSKAGQVEVGVDAKGDRVQVSCADNGVGFSPDVKTGIGMQSIQSRVNYLNGTMRVQSGSGGTSIIVKIPKQ
jgi:signal transduction histidine kinase